MITTQNSRTFSDARFKELALSLIELHDKKGRDYGSDEDPLQNLRASVNLGIHPWIGCLIRMNDKIFRLNRFAKKSSLKNESAIDSLRDIAVYSLLATILLEEE